MPRKHLQPLPCQNERLSVPEKNPSPLPHLDENIIHAACRLRLCQVNYYIRANTINSATKYWGYDA
jgi:hypothetical protein